MRHDLSRRDKRRNRYGRCMSVDQPGNHGRYEHACAAKLFLKPRRDDQHDREDDAKAKRGFQAKDATGLWRAGS